MKTLILLQTIMLTQRSLVIELISNHKHKTMRNTILFTMMLLSALMSCGIKADECAGSGCGNEVWITEDIELDTRFQGTVASGNIARYIWYTDFTWACTEKDAEVTLRMDINEALKIVPIEPKLWVDTGGALDEMTIDFTPGTQTSKYRVTSPFKLFNATAACNSDVRLRLQVDFESFGSRSLNDSYVEDLIAEDSYMVIRMTQVKE